MSIFSLSQIPSIYSEKDAIRHIPNKLRELGSQGTALIVIDRGLEASGYIKKLEGIFADAEHPYILSLMPQGEPKEAFVDETVELARKNKVDSAVCVGGGSAQDAGKLISALILAGSNAKQYRLAQNPLPSIRVPVICVPTTSGTGSEATAVSVIGQADGVKNWFWGPTLKPDLILLDPAITVGLPSHVTASTGVDAMVHAIEAATNKNATQDNNVFCLHAIRLVMQHLPTAVTTPTDLIARSGMQKAASFAGIGIDNAGTAIAHNIAHALGSLAGIPHGRAVAIGMCATLAWNIETHADIYRDVAEAMNTSCDKLAETFENFVRSVGIDISLEGESPKLSAENLAQTMKSRENIAMANANIRALSDDDFLTLAKNVIQLK